VELAGVNPVDLERSLWERGYAKTPTVLSVAECDELAALYADESRFRSRVDMARHRFGVGEYKYFASPLPPLVDELRDRLYPLLFGIANRWYEALGSTERFPPTLAAFHRVCEKHGQFKPTPLLLRYTSGGYNCLHQDIYGEIAFPLQVVAMLSRPGADFVGGEFLLVEQRPRAQSAGHVINPAQGELLVFTTRVRPVKGSRGYYRVAVRHGVSEIRSGLRQTLGIIFHQAR
jgi:hypothetical protein